MAVLYVFNPWHDLALAAHSPHFTPPLPARLFARDAAPLTWWIEGAPQAPAGEAYLLCEDLPDLPHLPAPPAHYLPPEPYAALPLVHYSQLRRLPLTRVVAWGWDALLCRRLREAGVDAALLPSEERLAQIRDFSHRKWALRAHAYLLEKLAGSSWLKDCPLAEPGQELHSLAQVRAFAHSHAQTVCKAPWSGSGKGLYWTQGGLDVKGEGWCRHILEAQGSVVAETCVAQVQDFAMEFYCDAADLRFEGYSLFQTRGGAYAGNRLAPQAQLQAELSTYVPLEALDACRQALTDFFRRHFCGRYSGYLGVDMLVFRQGGGYGLHPVVEVNARMTMGLLALRAQEVLPQIGEGDHSLRVRYHKDPEAQAAASASLTGRLPLDAGLAQARYAVECVRESL